MQYRILLAGFLTSLAISLLAIPSIVRVARHKGLYNEPREKTGKIKKVPTLGGLAIFAGTIISLCMFADIRELKELPYLIAGAVVLFFIGIKDDILVTAPWWKLVGQILVALAITIPGELRIPEPGKFIGIDGGGTTVEILATVLFMVIVINSINLIDGIDGLASGIGITVSVILGMACCRTGLESWGLVAAALTGSLAGFAWYNVFGRKNKILMGDTGSLLLGYFVGVMSVRFLGMEQPELVNLRIQTPLAFLFAVLVIPVFDTLRIVVLRLMQGRSPLRPDRQHIHYRLVDTGFSHLQATGVLVGTNLLLISLVLVIHETGEIAVILVLLVVSTVLSLIPGHYLDRRKKREGKF
jgi:UDP-N-acetylmuramyl pentapeptide phosphotransferase/UDP-N-acetylglucosamine-1-phosphate transferase